MKPLQIFSATVSANMDDIVFEKRNRQYGAYYLRKHYGEHIREALLFTFLFVAFITLAIQWSLLLRNKIKTGPSAVQTPPEIVLRNKLPEFIVEALPPSTPETENSDASKKIVKDSLPVLTNEKQHDTTTIASTTSVGAGNSSDLSNPIPSSGLPLPPGNGSAGLTSIVEGYDEKPVDWADVLPSFIGGDKALKKYLASRIKFSEAGEIAGTSGKVIISFVVTKTGEIKDVKVLDDKVGYGCAELASEVVKRMPHWNPGKNNGQPVNVRMVLPVYFSQ